MGLEKQTIESKDKQEKMHYFLEYSLSPQARHKWNDNGIFKFQVDK